jgi:hypothetical protein
MAIFIRGQLQFVRTNFSCKKAAMIRHLLALLTLCLITPALAQDEPDGRSILARATEAHGGDRWAEVRTLKLTGSAVFWGKSGAAPTSAPDSYIMHRAFDPDRTAAHGAEGKLRIAVSDKGRLVFNVGFDGTTTWNDKGIVPKAEADAYWASNFGFGIIRHALKPGFAATRLADANVDGHAVYMVRLIDPAGTESLFGIDRATHAVRMVGFATPRGWHVRSYADFFRPADTPWWLQAGKVTLTYNGVKQNEVHWREAKVNATIDENLFAPPQ